MSRPPKLLLVEDDPLLADQMRWALKPANYEIVTAGERHAAQESLRVDKPDVVLLDLCLPPTNTPEEGFGLLKAARAAGATVVVMSALGERDVALRAIADGAYDFFDKPVDVASLRVVVARALERQNLERENERLRQQLRHRFGLEGLVGTSRAMLQVAESVRRVADSPVTVMLLGESGTGKGVVARAIHHASARRSEPFVAVHCAAFPETLLEAELFGHEKGAFTGAEGRRLGRFEAANGGTLFLDEIACLTPTMQIKLLRVLEERTVERLGANTLRPVDIRLIVASNEDLEAKVRKGEFREDFFFRVKGYPLTLPPLRARPEDIPLLAEHFLKQACEDGKVTPRRFSPEARAALMEQEWPGNIRELRHVVETLALLADGETVGIDDVARACPPPLGGSLPGRGGGFKDAVEVYERRLLVEAIERAGGVKAQAARELGLDPSQMKYLVRKHGL